MNHEEGLVANKPPLLIRNNYVFWSVRMRCHLMSLGCKICSSVEKGYKIPDNLPTNRYELYECEPNAKDLNAILKVLADSMFVKVMQCNTTKHAWEKIKIAYEGASKVKKIQTSNIQRAIQNSKDERRIKYCRISSKII